MKLFPCYPDKRPATPNGFKDASDDDTQLDAWVDAGYEFWGTPTGEEFWVLDVDKKSGGLDTLGTLERTNGTINTRCIETQNGGFHFYFKPNAQVKTRAGILPGIDTRGAGGYVICPPSPGYTVIDAQPISEAPQWVVDLVVPKEKPAVSLSSTSSDVIEGGRNAYLTSVAGKLQRSGLSGETLEAALLAENEAKCSPPLVVHEVLTIVKSISRYVPGDPVVPGKKNWTAARDLVGAMFAYLGNKDLVKGEPTDIPEIDALLGGGKRLGEITVTHAEAKTGKNSLWHQLMLSWLDRGIPVGYASREISPETEVMPSLLTIALKKNIRLMEMDDPLIVEMTKRVEPWPLYFTDGYGAFEINELRGWVSDLVSKGVKYFWIDHLHYLLFDPEDHKEASKFIKSLKTMAKEYNVHFDLIVQPNKMGDGQSLGINSIKGGAAIGQALDNLFTMKREVDVDTGKKMDVIKLTLEVARSPLARPGHIYLMYDRELQTFTVAEEKLVENEDSGKTSRVIFPSLN